MSRLVQGRNRLPASTVELASRSIAPNTRRAYTGAMKMLRTWLEGRELEDGTLAEYLTHLYQHGRSPATAAIVVAAVRFSSRGTARRVIGPATQAVMAGYRRQAGHRGSGQTCGLRWEEADRIVRETAPDGLAGCRDAAIIAMASDAMLRIGELAALRVSDVSQAADGSGRVLIRHSKTDQEGKGVVLYLGQPTLRHVFAWIRRANLQDGMLFRHVANDKLRGPSLTSRSIARIIAKRADEAGFSGRVSGHSFRVGSAQSLAAHGASVVEMQQAGRWQSPRMPGHYAKGELAGRGAVARLRYRKAQ